MLFGFALAGNQLGSMSMPRLAPAFWPGRRCLRDQSTVSIHDAGREYFEAYVPYIHLVERLYDLTRESAHGHYHESEQLVAHVH